MKRVLLNKLSDFLGFIYIESTDEKWLTCFWILYIIQDYLSFSNLVVKLYTFLYIYGQQWTQLLVFYVLHGSNVLLLGIVILLHDLNYGQWKNTTSILFMGNNQHIFLFIFCIDPTKISAYFNISRIWLLK